MKKPSIPLLRNIVGPGLRRLRNERRLTQEEFVVLLQLKGWDVSRETWAKIEAQLRWVTDFEIAFLLEALRIDMADLLPRTGRKLAVLDFMQQHQPPQE